MLSTNVRNFIEGGGGGEGGNLPAPIVPVTANKTLDLTDAQTLQQVDSTASRTITVPTHASVEFPVGTEMEIVRWNTGAVTISPASGVPWLQSPQPEQYPQDMALLR